ncbi:MAG: DUF1566 domain-containing protein [Campylobacterota bacterium]|nr:DUF1566 domain-containing protein [Campylobacterota bacterium]
MRTILLILIGLSTLLQAERFTRDATAMVVTDTQTNLQWQDDAAAKTTRKNWQDAITHCEGLTLGDEDDWRLPNLNELYYIADRDIYNPALSSVFVNVVSSNYWSSTTDASDTSNAWGVYFYYGSDYWGTKSISCFVRCVRAGQ